MDDDGIISEKEMKKLFENVSSSFYVMIFEALTK